MYSLNDKLNSSKINLIEFLGVFIAIFSVISINVSSLSLIKGLTYFWDKVGLICVINLTLIISIGAMLFFIKRMFK